MLPHNKQWWNETILIITFAIVTLICALAITSTARGDTLATIKNPNSWLKDRAIKYGLITSFCTAQAATGLIESAKYGGIHISNSADNYHAFRLLQDASFISTGFFTYATIHQPNKPWWAKGCRILGAACYARDANELTYRWNVTGSPFNYSDKYSSNKKAVVYWDVLHWNFKDIYISGTGKQGAAIDIGFAVAGWALNRVGDIR